MKGISFVVSIKCSHKPEDIVFKNRGNYCFTIKNKKRTQKQEIKKIRSSERKTASMLQNYFELNLKL